MQISTIGLDLAKHAFQVHGVDADEKIIVRKQLRRSQVIAFFEKLPPCLVGIRLVPQRIIGRGSSRNSATPCG
jgi:transposase